MYKKIDAWNTDASATIILDDTGNWERKKSDCRFSLLSTLPI